MTISSDGSKEQFYQECAKILGSSAGFEAWKYSAVTRWNNRQAGNGRYQGFGIVRMFGPSHIRVALRRPVEINKTCRSKEEVFALLRDVVHHRG